MANPSSTFPTLVTGVTVQVATNGGLSGDGSALNKLSVDSSDEPAPGSDTQVIFNDGGIFGGDAGLTYNKTTDVLTLVSAAEYPASAIVSKGTTAGDYFTGITALNTLSSVDPVDGIHLEQYDNGDGGLIAGDYGAEILMAPDFSRIALYADAIGLNGAATITGQANLYGYVNIGRTIDNAAAAGALNGTDIRITKTNTATPATGFSQWQTLVTFGYGAAAAIGSPILNNDVLLVTGSGDASNEYNMNYRELRVNIGTGFTQSLGPTGFITYGDERMDGPIALQPGTFNGQWFNAQNYYNGAPGYGSSTGAAIWTYYGISNDPTHAAADTYPIDIGLAIFGHSKASGVTGVGFTTALQLGGGVSPALVTSKIGTGLVVRDYTTKGIYIHTPSGSPTASIDADGLVKAGSFAVGAAAGIDTTVTTASLVGKTITISKGLITGFA